MAIAYILAHFDDEFGAMPVIRAARDAGIAQHFLYTVDYPRPTQSQDRAAESRAYLRNLGLDPACVDHVALGTGVMDGDLHRGLAEIYPVLRARLSKLGRIEKLVTPAWEGGHVDHDGCAVLATALAAEFGAPVVEQFSLYHGAGLPGRLFHAVNPLKENGPVTRSPLTPAEILRWSGDVRFYPSQAKTWLGLWPTMFASVASRGWGVQRLEPGRIRERPHAGSLYYERVFRVAHAEVRERVDDFLRSRAGPA